MKVIDVLTDAYGRIFEQLCLSSAHEDENGVSVTNIAHENAQAVISDQVKFLDGNNRFFPVELTADQSKLWMHAKILIPVNLSGASDFPVLKVLNRINQSGGPTASSLNEEAIQIEMHSGVSYAGSYAMQEMDWAHSSGVEVEVTMNLLASLFSDANYWTKKIQILETPGKTEADVFRTLSG